MRFGLRVLMVVVLSLAILVPLAMVRGVIDERQEHRNQAVARIARSHAGAQAFAGPVLVVPYNEEVAFEEKDAGGQTRAVWRTVQRRWTFFPATLRVEGRLAPATRRLGLHEVRVYEWQAQAAAGFRAAIPADADPARPRRIGRPYLAYALADVRGLVGTPRLRVGGRALTLEEGFGARNGGGVHVRLAPPAAGTRLDLDTRLDFTLGGTESLAIVPLARDNRIVLDSAWPHPRFGGSFLPRAPRIDGRGFHAEWDVSSLATGAQAQFLAGQPLPRVDAGGNTLDARRAAAGMSVEGMDAVAVSLVDPVNVYSQADRATKYGILFVVLTFGGFFLLEMLKRLPIHPIQYLLVGLALATFFLLLVSLSEHVAFGRAYVAASVACLGLVGIYLGAVLRSRARGFAFAAALALLYAALYGLLVSEDNALVLGAGLLFAILAAVMVATRKVDWYALTAR